MPTNTYVALDKATASGSASTITFNSIPATYTDLIIVVNAAVTSGESNLNFQFNGDTSSNYSYTQMAGTGSSPLSTNASSQTSGRVDYYGYLTTGRYSNIIQIMDYANTTTFKTVISRSGNESNGTSVVVNTWRKTPEAINSVTLLAGSNFTAGSTFALYGIAAEGVTPAPKATGGTIYSDSTYYYHVFGSTGVFTPLQTLTCDYIVTAGGGGGGCAGGGGGAGSVIYNTNKSLSATGYTVTVGAGGNGSSSRSANGSNGGNSSFNATTATGGGQGASNNNNNGFAGGSGGGAVNNGGTGGSASAGTLDGGTGYVNAGGNGVNALGAGGGGAGQAGQTATSSIGGLGGNGTTVFSSWGSATGIGELISGSYYLAGGGGGYSDAIATGGFGGGGASGTGSNNGSNGLSNMGGGGGASRNGPSGNGGNGGSGVVIVRYLKA